MAETRLWAILQGMIMERQRLLIREANYLRGLVGLPPVRAGRGRLKEDVGGEHRRPGAQ